VLVLAGHVGTASTPTIFRTAPGRFEIAATDIVAAQACTIAAEEAWQTLSLPLALPEAFSTPVFVRVTRGTDSATTTANIFVEPGGIVSLSIVAVGGRVDDEVRRGLVRALLAKLVVSERGAVDMNRLPAWLEAGCVGWWNTRRDPAQRDALKLASQALSPPTLPALFSRTSGDVAQRDFTVGATWLLTFLQSEARPGEWADFRRRVLRGEDSVAALAASFPGRFATVEERELWWQTGWHHLRRVSSLPLLDARDSPAMIERLVRFVVLRGDSDVPLSLAEMLDHADQPCVRDELARRAAALERVLPALHPFFRNAGLSLAHALASCVAPSGQRTAAVNAFAADWRDALELAAASNAALDELEASRAPEARR
jgi:hypothetical protein